MDPTPLDAESQLFVEDASQAVDFATEILRQLPSTDRRRELLSNQLNDQVSLLVSGFNEATQQLFDPDSAPSERFAKAAGVLQGDGAVIEQMRVLRGFYAGRCWQAAIAVLSVLLEEDQRYEVTELNNAKEFQAWFESYQDMIAGCSQCHAENCAAVQNGIELQEKLAAKATEMNTNLAEFQSGKKGLASEMDAAAIDSAQHCDELVAEIDLLTQTIGKKQAEATQAAFKCRICINPKRKNEKLLTVQQTVNLINEVWTAKQKHDLAQLKLKKQSEAIRYYLHRFFSLKFGAGLKTAKSVQNFIYSVGYYAEENNVCAVFLAEIQLEIDEVFKHNVLKIEQKIDEHAGLDCRQLLELIYRDSEVVNLLFGQIDADDRGKLKNVVNLFELEKHKQALKGYRTAWLKQDAQKIGKMTLQQFTELCAEMGSKSVPETVAAAAKGLESVLFTHGVVALCEHIFK